jgi:hypothetical protein
MSTIYVYDTDNDVKDLATLKAKSKTGGLRKKNKEGYIVWVSVANPRQWG